MTEGNSMRNASLTAVVVGIMMTGPALSATDNPATNPAINGMAHGVADESHVGNQPRGPSRSTPALAGQDAFAAIQEIVIILEADPETDWSRVDLDALRRHLVDMNALMLRVESEARNISGGIEIIVHAAEPAARRMVPAHADELAKIDGWSATARVDGDGRVVLRVAATDPEQITRIRGLGFFGLMATGAHHQQHHLAVARGGGMHE